MATSKVSSRAAESHARIRSVRSGMGQALIRDVIESITHFYKQAAEMAQLPTAKKLFLSLAEEEQKQLGTIRPLRKSDYIKTGLSSRMIRRMIAALKRKEGDFLQEIGAVTSDEDAYRMVMALETESIRIYTNLLPEIKASVQKELVNRLLKEEHERYTTFENTCLYLSDSANWNLWNEHGIADGGTNWA